MSAAGSVEFDNIAQAAKLQYAHVVAEMLANGEDVDAQDDGGSTALHWSALLCLDSLTSLLLAHDARTDIVNLKGDAAVHNAARSRSVEQLHLLSSDKGAHSSPAVFGQRNALGRTAFLLAAEQNDASLMEWLYLQGASIEDRDDTGRTALQLAGELGHTRTLQWLLSRSASLAERCQDGRTALHLAAAAGHLDTTKMLAEAGAVQHLRSMDRNGNTPLDLAWRGGHWQVLLWLLRARFMQVVVSFIPKKSLKNPDTLLWAVASQSVWSGLFLLLVLLNSLVFLCILAPALFEDNLRLVLCWPLLISGVLALWFYTATSNPGWSSSRTIHDQSERILAQEDEIQDMLALSSLPIKQQVARVTQALPSSGPAEGGRSRADDPPVDQDPSSSSSIRNFKRIMSNPQDGHVTRGEELRHVDYRQLRLARQQQLLIELRSLTGIERDISGRSATPLLEADWGQGLSLEERDEVEQQIRRSSEAMQPLHLRLIERAGIARNDEMRALGRNDYLDLVQKGEFRNICVICHSCRPQRCFHCKQCGRCVNRLDHHCPWIDRCVGINNQRSFYVFLLVLFAAILSFYSLGCIFLVEVARTSKALVADFLVLLTLALDTGAGLFVGALIIRQTAYKLVNITTYEVLVCPPHVQQRFPSRSRRFWFLADISWMGAVRNFVSYWMLDMTKDSYDFGEEPPVGADEFSCTMTQEDVTLFVDTCWGESPQYGYKASGVPPHWEQEQEPDFPMRLSRPRPDDDADSTCMREGVSHFGEAQPLSNSRTVLVPLQGL